MGSIPSITMLEDSRINKQFVRHFLGSGKFSANDVEFMSAWVASNTVDELKERLSKAKSVYMSVLKTFADHIYRPEQKETSRKTSINSSRLPKGVSEVIRLGVNGKVVFDYGCGLYGNSKVAVEQNGGYYVGFDPYNQGMMDNIAALYILMFCDLIDVIVCSNVLNVIKNDSVVKAIITDISELSPSPGLAVINVYEGDKSGVGKLVREDQYQRNEKTSVYFDKFKSLSLRHQTDVITRKGFIYVKKTCVH